MRPGRTRERLHGQTSCPQHERHHWLQTEGKVLRVQQHPHVRVIGSLAFESVLKILQKQGAKSDHSLNLSGNDALLLDTTAFSRCPQI